MIQLLLIAYAACGVATVALAMWIRLADDPETYFWGLLLWPILLLAMIGSVVRSVLTGREIFHEEERARVRGFPRPNIKLGIARFRIRKRHPKRWR
jgi:hypothetical protein